MNTKEIIYLKVIGYKTMEKIIEHGQPKRRLTTSIGEKMPTFKWVI